MALSFRVLVGFFTGGGLGLLLGGCQPSPTLPLRISVVGDILLARNVPPALARDSTALARSTRGWWGDSRYVIGNLECPLMAHQQPVAKPFAFRAADVYA